MSMVRVVKSHKTMTRDNTNVFKYKLYDDTVYGNGDLFRLPSSDSRKKGPLTSIFYRKASSDGTEWSQKMVASGQLKRN